MKDVSDSIEIPCLVSEEFFRVFKMATNYPIAGGDIKDAQIYLSIHQENGN